MPATFLQARQALARAMDDLEGPFIAGAGSANTTASTALITGDTNASANRYNGRWIYVSSGTNSGQSKRIRTAGFAPSTGTLTSDPAWAFTPTSDQIEITSLFPAVTNLTGTPSSDTDYRTLLNRALAKLLVPDRITVPITTAQTYPLTTWAYWLDRPERLLRVLEPPPAGAIPVDSGWRKWRLRLDADLPVLELPVAFPSASGNLILEVLRPANTWIAVSGTYAESTVGFGVDSDEARIGIEELVMFGQMEAYQVLMNRSPGRPNGDWSKKYADVRSRAENLYHFDGAYWSRKSQQQMAAPEERAA